MLFNNVINWTSSRFYEKVYWIVCRWTKMNLFFACLWQVCEFCCVDLKKESIVCWCCHFKWAACISLSCSDMACGFVMFVRVNSDGLFVKVAGTNRARCRGVAAFVIGGGWSSASQESWRAFALRSKLGGSILCPKAISTSSDVERWASVMASPSLIIWSSNGIPSCPRCSFDMTLTKL